MLVENRVNAWGEIGGNAVLDECTARGDADQSWTPWQTVAVDEPFDDIFEGLELKIWQLPIVTGPYLATFQDFNLP